MYHIELRQFPHNFCHFNLTEQELRETILDAWARGEWVEFGERKWNPQQAKLLVLEGPPIPVAQLSMGRGWSSARRHGHDVTERMTAAARTTPTAAGDEGLAADSLGLEVLSRLTTEPMPVALAWRVARERYPERPASDCLKLAELAIGALSDARLVVVFSREAGSEPRLCHTDEDLKRALSGIDGWRDEDGQMGVFMRRA